MLNIKAQIKLLTKILDYRDIVVLWVWLMAFWSECWVHDLTGLRCRSGRVLFLTNETQSSFPKTGAHTPFIHIYLHLSTCYLISRFRLHKTADHRWIILSGLPVKWLNYENLPIICSEMSSECLVRCECQSLLLLLSFERKINLSFAITPVACWRKLKNPRLANNHKPKSAR